MFKFEMKGLFFILDCDFFRYDEPSNDLFLFLFLQALHALSYQKLHIRLYSAGSAQLGDDFVTYMKVDENCAIELFLTDGSLLTHEVSEEYAGVKHIAFSVDSVDEWHEHLVKHGCRITLEPTDLEPIRKRVLLFEAPDYVIIELSQNMI